jgi:bacillithiol biosynthesis deacetylase BshB1
MKLDILAIGSHPDDVELGCSGTLMKHIDLGFKVGILDLTKGELGTRGNANTRAEEVKASTKILGVHARENMGFADGFFKNDKEHQLELVKMIRRYQPSIIIANAIYDRHPDHARAAQLTYEASFLSGLSKIETKVNGKLQTAFRPRAIYNYIQAIHIQPAFAVDITDYFERKIQAIQAFKSQFFSPASDPKGPQTFISTPQFLEFVKGRAVHFGTPIGVKYAEAYTTGRLPGVKNLMDLI